MIAVPDYPKLSPDEYFESEAKQEVRLIVFCSPFI
jgi:hypothetical protein